MKPTLLIALLISMAGAAVVPQAGLRFYYTFDQQTMSGSKIKDMSGNGYDLTSSGPMKFSTDRFFNAGGALKMDGTYHLSALLPDSTVHAMTRPERFHIRHCIQHHRAFHEHVRPNGHCRSGRPVQFRRFPFDA